MREEGVYVESFQADEPLESRVRARRGTVGQVERLKGSCRPLEILGGVRLGLPLSIVLLLLLVILGLLGHGFGHELLERHVVTFIIGVPLGLMREDLADHFPSRDAKRRERRGKKKKKKKRTHSEVDLSGDEKSLGSLDALVELDGFVVEGLVAHVAQHALDFKLAAAPGGGKDLAGDFLLVLGLFLVGPVGAAAFLELGHLLDGHLGVDGGGDGGPGLLGEGPLILEASEEARDAEEFLRLDEGGGLLQVGGADGVENLDAEGFHLQVLHLEADLLLKGAADITALVGLGPEADAVDELAGEGVDALLAGPSPLHLEGGQQFLLLLGQTALLLLLVQLLFLGRETGGLQADVIFGLGHDGLLAQIATRGTGP
jgi:hypothetical protein